MLSFILDLIYPRRCLSCGTFGSYLCNHCVTLLYNNVTNICPICERPSINGATHPRCRTRYTIDGLISFWQYEGIVRKIIHKIKYDPFISAAVKEIIEKINTPPMVVRQPAELLGDEPILIPIPLHKSRLRWRGYNHAALIAKAFAQKWNLKVNENLLIRVKKTKPQIKLKGKERIENVKEAFAINHLATQPFSHFIIVDDVWTTGSTLKTCATLLKRSGAKSVWGLTLAR